MIRSATISGEESPMSKAIYFCILILFLLFSYADVGESVEIEADVQFEFARQYFSSREYDRAISEYERFIFFFPEDARIPQAMYEIALSYFESKNFKKALAAFAEIADKYGDAAFSAFSAKAYFMISECYLKLDDPGQAVSNLYNLIALGDDKNIRDECFYRIGWIYIETASWDKAKDCFGKISPENKDDYRLQILADELNKTDSIAIKNPSISAGLAIFPGAGFLYCNRYQDALAAFLLNTGLMYAAYEAFDKENYALGGLTGIAELGFYAGSIYGSVTAAHKYNRAKTQSFIEKLKQKTKVVLSSGYENPGVMIVFSSSF